MADSPDDVRTRGGPVMCPISPALAELLQRPGGLTTDFPVRCWLDTDNVLWMEEIRPEGLGRGR